MGFNSAFKGLMICSWAAVDFHSPVTVGCKVFKSAVGVSCRKTVFVLLNTELSANSSADAVTNVSEAVQHLRKVTSCHCAG